MGAFTISGAVRPEMIPELGVSTLTVRWQERAPQVQIEPREAFNRLRRIQAALRADGRSRFPRPMIRRSYGRTTPRLRG